MTHLSTKECSEVISELMSGMILDSFEVFSALIIFKFVRSDLCGVSCVTLSDSSGIDVVGYSDQVSQSSLIGPLSNLIGERVNSAYLDENFGLIVEFSEVSLHVFLREDDTLEYAWELDANLHNSDEEKEYRIAYTDERELFLNGKIVY